jgi:hypothetical protein
MTSKLLFTATILTLFLTCCSKTPTWFQGSFVFNPPETAKSMKTKDLSNDALAYKIMLEADVGIDKPILNISSGEIVALLNGSGDSMKYEIIQSPDENTIVIKKSNGNVETWQKTDSGITSPKGDYSLHFKRLE